MNYNKNDLKIKFKNTKKLIDYINETYNIKNDVGHIKNISPFTIDDDDIDLSNLNRYKNIVVKILNDVIEGGLTILIDQIDGKVAIKPLSSHLIIENNKYIFL